MNRTKSAAVDNRPLGDPRSWSRSPGTYITGRAYIDGVDETASEMEAKWGAGRLRLLVEPELREKFDRQRYLHNQAIWHGDLESVRRECGRMTNAWLALNRAAEAAGAVPLSPLVWEVVLDNGSVAAIVPDGGHAGHVVRDGRQVAVYTMEEIGKLLSAYPLIVAAKETFPGATVEKISRGVDDPMDGIWDTKEPLDDPVPDLGA